MKSKESHTEGSLGANATDVQTFDKKLYFPLSGNCDVCVENLLAGLDPIASDKREAMMPPCGYRLSRVGKKVDDVVEQFLW